MANKNTKQRNAVARKARKTGDNPVISENKEKNFRMVVYKNKGANKAGNGSLTVMEPIDKNVPMNKTKHSLYNTPRPVEIATPVINEDNNEGV